MFQDREDAGRQLSRKLEGYRDAEVVVLALPRGGVVIGREIANYLNLSLDIVVTRKIAHPENPEYAVCAVDEHGTLLCNEEEKRVRGEIWFNEELNKQIDEARRRTKIYRNNAKPVKIMGKTAIITDDGIATGLTMRLAIKAAKAPKPKRIVVAIPVIPPEVMRVLNKEVDEVITLLSPAEFLGAVGAHYRDFRQIEDNEVIELLDLGNKK